MLAFYGWKGCPKAGLIQEVAIEAGHAVTEIPTWMGLTARWEVKCVSLKEANDILAGCRRLEQENRRRERRYYQERLASMHQPSGLSAIATLFQPQAAPLLPQLAEMASDQHKLKGSRPKAGFPPAHRSIDATSDVGLVDPSSHKREKEPRQQR